MLSGGMPHHYLNFTGIGLIFIGVPFLIGGKKNHLTVVSILGRICFHVLSICISSEKTFYLFLRKSLCG